MDAEGLAVAISASAGAAVAVGEAMRRYWTRREARQQEAFARSVGRIVEVKVAELLTRQEAFERRQGQHLDRQDRAIENLRRQIRILMEGRHD